MERELSQNHESVAFNEGDLCDRSRLRKIMVFLPGVSLVMGMIALILCILSGEESALTSLLLTATIFQTVFSSLSLGATFIFKRRPGEFVRSGMLGCGLISSLMVGLFGLEVLLMSPQWVKRLRLVAVMKNGKRLVVTDVNKSADDDNDTRPEGIVLRLNRLVAFGYE